MLITAYFNRQSESRSELPYRWGSDVYYSKLQNHRNMRAHWLSSY